MPRDMQVKVTIDQIKAREAAMRELGKAINAVLEEMYGQQMGFFLSVFEFGTEGDANYISNGQREDMIKALKETVRRFESGETMPPIIGSA